MAIYSTGLIYSDDGEQSAIAECYEGVATIYVTFGSADAEITLSNDDMLKFAKSIIEMIETQE